MPLTFAALEREGPEAARALCRQNAESLLFQRPDDAIHRGYDKQTERDMSKPGTFVSNFEPLTRSDLLRRSGLSDGDLDTLATIEAARRLEAHLLSGSSTPVVFAELPGGHHGFDLFYSLRYEAVVDGIEAFTAWLQGRGMERP